MVPTRSAFETFNYPERDLQICGNKASICFWHVLYTCIEMVLFYSVTYLPATPSQFSSLPPFSVISSKTGCFVRAWACNVTQNSHARGSVNRLKWHFRPGQRQCKAIGVHSHGFGHRHQHGLCDYRFIVMTVVRHRSSYGCREVTWNYSTIYMSDPFTSSPVHLSHSLPVHAIYYFELNKSSRL